MLPLCHGKHFLCTWCIGSMLGMLDVKYDCDPVPASRELLVQRRNQTHWQSFTRSQVATESAKDEVTDCLGVPSQEAELVRYLRKDESSRHSFSKEWCSQRWGGGVRELGLQGAPNKYGWSAGFRVMVIKFDHVVHPFEITLRLSGSKPCLAHNVICTWPQSPSPSMLFTLFSLSDSCITVSSSIKQRTTSGHLNLTHCFFHR